MKIARVEPGSEAEVLGLGPVSYTHLMSREILNTCPEVLHYTGIWTDTLRGGATQLVNTNKLLKRYNGITGLKTGTTSGAGVCISASATRDGLDLIAVVLGSLSSSERFTAATTLLDYGFAAYAAVPLPAMEDRPLLIKVKGSAEESVPLDYTALPETLLMPKESAADVYKRQEQILCRLLHVHDGLEHGAGAFLNELTHGVQTVSYTHLEVYKRQRLPHGRHHWRRTHKWL